MKGAEYIELANSQNSKKNLRYAKLLNVPTNKLTDSYSTGMKKKLAFSAIITLPKSIHILDEPFNGVDLESNEIIRAIIEQEKTNKTIIISSHIFSTLIGLCDNIFHIEEGFTHTHYSQSEFSILQEVLQKRIIEKMKIVDNESGASFIK